MAAAVAATHDLFGDAELRAAEPQTVGRTSVQVLSLLAVLALVTLVVVVSFYAGFHQPAPTLTSAEPTVRVIAVPSRGVWRFEYQGTDGVLGTADDVYSENRLYVAASTPCTLELLSPECQTSFFVPEQRIKSDVPRGQSVAVALHASDQGSTALFFCAEYCGALHYKMSGRIFFLGPTVLHSSLARLPKVSR